MPTGLVALLDDIAVIARAASTSVDDVAVLGKAAAASVDDIGVAAGRAGVKAAGVVIDDAAVTPSYVTGLSPARELPIIARITIGSLKNKLLILLPAALILSALLPWLITPILMLGGAYLAYEGAEKVIEKLTGAKHGATLEDPIADPVEFERQRISSAIRTDLILSAEIMAITLAEVATESLLSRAAILAVVGIGITFAVYGAVALLVKMDDVGLYLAKKSSAILQTVGRLMVRAMPHMLVALSFIGTIAMMWVGGGIILHGLDELGVHAPADFAHGIEHAIAGASGALGGVTGWLSYAVLSALFGLVLGGVIALVLHKALGAGGHKTAEAA